MNWRKARRSMADGNCAEIGNWRKSPYSYALGNCVEAGDGQSVIGVRDTRDNGQGPVLEYTPAAWKAFITRVKAL